MINPIAWLEKQIAKVVRGYQFVNDVLFYLQRGHHFKDAVNMANKVFE